MNKPTAAGSIKVSAVVKFANGATATGNGKCEKTLTVNEVPKTPVHKCDLLTVTHSTIKVGGVVTATASYTAAGGATFKSATFNFGEGNPVVVTNANNVSAQYSYTKAGNKTVTAAITFTVNGKDVTVEAAGNCVKQVTVTDEPVVVTNCDALDANKTAIKLGDTVTYITKATAENTTITEYISSINGASVQSGSTKAAYDNKPATVGDYTVSVKVKFANGGLKGGEGVCAKKVTATVDTPPCEYDSTLPKDSKDRKPPVFIPDTGAGSVIGAFAGVTVAGALLHNVLARRGIRE